MEEGRFPYGYTHGQKRSHAQTEESEASASPAWNARDASGDPPVHLNPHSLCVREDRPPPVNENLRFHLRQITNPYSPSYPPTERPASAGAVHPITPDLVLPPIRNMPSAAPRRYAGDGFDFRRPARVATPFAATPVDLSGEDDSDDNIPTGFDDDVIDLTADDSGYGASQEGNNERLRNNNNDNNNEDGETRRPPRLANDGPRRLPHGMDIIIDLDNGDEEWRLATPPAAVPGSPEIEFISAREIDPPQRQRAFGRSNSDGDEVEFVRANPLPDAEIERRRGEEMDRVMNLIGDFNGGFTHLRAQVERFNARLNRTAAGLQRRPVIPPRGVLRRQHIQAGFEAPRLLDFEHVGFDLGMGARPPAPPPAPTYNAPPPASDGFTRSPEEEGALVCPNCEEELCVGEDEVKRQVWIVKLCGHVYCGECTANRSVKKSSKGKEKPPRTKPFKECAVEGCDKKVSNAKSMIQVYL